MSTTSITYNDAYNILTRLSYNDFQRIKKEISSIELQFYKSKKTSYSFICPYCGSSHIKKNGHDKNGFQKFLCLENNCKKFFSERTNTLLYRSKKLSKCLPTMIECILSKDTIRKTKTKCGISLETALNWRNKIVYLSKNLFNVQLKDVVEFDETFTPFNFKGTKKEKMPRPSKKRGEPTISRRELICIGMAVDTNDNLVTKILGNGTHPIYNRLNSNFGEIIDKKSIFVCDKEQGLLRFCKESNLIYEEVESERHTSKNGYNINTINGIHSEYKLFLKPFRGVSTRHIESYIYWFRLFKLLKYHIEEDNYLPYLYKALCSLKLDTKIFLFQKFHKRPYRVKVYSLYRKHKKLSWKYNKNVF